MDRETAWYLFEQTGNIEAYMLYNDLAGGALPPGAHSARAVKKAAPKAGRPSAGRGLPPQAY